MTRYSLGQCDNYLLSSLLKIEKIARYSAIIVSISLKKFDTIVNFIKIIVCNRYRNILNLNSF